MVRALKGLEGVLSMTVVHPIWQSTQPDGSGDDHRGWVFAKSRTRGGGVSNSDGLGGPFPNCYEGNQPDPIHGAASMRELYEKSGNADGNYKVPILWDKQTGTIVSKESWQIMRILNVAFNEFAKNPGLDLYPEGDRSKIDAVCDWMYPTLNNGVYRCGFAMTQKAYDDSLDDLAVAFDQVEGHLRKHRYLCGPALTEADLRLFVTLIRFDEVYSIYFKCNVRSVADSPTLLGYCQDLYQMVGIRETIDMQQIKAHYYCSHPDLNRYSIIPRGRGFLKLLEEHHNRSDLP
jgi:putative glutathione S-transferase